jgi:hypothetical protein
VTMGRKEAIKEFKARKVARGVFAVRCTATGRVWVDSSWNLDAAQNGLWHFLRNGHHPDPALQAEWNAHGAEAFQFEVLEKLDEDALAIEARDLLKEKTLHWAAHLGAQTLSPV